MTLMTKKFQSDFKTLQVDETEIKKTRTERIEKIEEEREETREEFKKTVSTSRKETTREIRKMDKIANKCKWIRR